MDALKCPDCGNKLVASNTTALNFKRVVCCGIRPGKNKRTGTPEGVQCKFSGLYNIETREFFTKKGKYGTANS